MIDAARLVGVNVMGLINAHTAAALQFGIERDFANKTQVCVAVCVWQRVCVCVCVCERLCVQFGIERDFANKTQVRDCVCVCARMRARVCGCTLLVLCMPSPGSHARSFWQRMHLSAHTQHVIVHDMGSSATVVPLAGCSSCMGHNATPFCILHNFTYTPP